jgi:septum formation protein
VTVTDAAAFVLASASPRRRELLAAAGYIFEVAAADVDETVRDGESPRAYVARVARAKAEAVAPRYPGRFILAADTTVVIDDVILGKPVDAGDAARMLQRLSGRTHEVLTGIALLTGDGGLFEMIESTDVEMAALADADIAWYVASGEPMDKAGGYAIQGRASRFVRRIVGSHSNVVGLPIAALAALFARAGMP